MKSLLIVIVCIAVACAAKPRFNLFQRQQEVPHALYGPPPQETTTQVQEESTTTESPTTTEAQSEQVNGTRTSGRLTKGKERGVYYIYHPSGQLQKVAYSSRQDPRSKAYTTQLKYEDVEPIRAPIFSVDPQTGALTRLQP